MNRPPDDRARAPKLVIVDDDPEILSQLELALRREYDVRTAASAKAAWREIQADPPDVITLDLALEGSDPESGFSLLERCLAFDPFIKVIMITANDNQANALRAIDQGAADFFGKPVDIPELRVLLRRSLAMARLERQNADLLRRLGHEQSLGALVGRSAAMQDVFRRIEKAAGADIAVLLAGESGTGKELAARELRRLSERATKPFVTIDCGAIPESLVEREIFGHEQDAAADASESRPGRLEAAQGGIVFLDEISALPPRSQSKLARLLQEHAIERAGGHDSIALDVRIIAATSRDLEAQVRQGGFRQDLYYRLSVVEIRLPALRERREDVPLLAQYFLDRFCQQFNRGSLALTPRAKAALQEHAWPGNVRELEQRILRAVVMSSGRRADVSDLELDELRSLRPVPLREVREGSDRQAIREALRFTGGNISLAAEILGVSRPSLHALLTKLEIRAEDFKTRASP